MPQELFEGQSGSEKGVGSGKELLLRSFRRNCLKGSRVAGKASVAIRSCY
ncbi:MAG: hypothetical protein J6K90_03760 [Tidjanibacter sp.]|nr:hypothetical protein [Tidjanibacter sp.]